MGEETKIEWCDHSWSPWRGRTKVSPGCARCYAETLSKRNPAVLGQWGHGKPRVLAKNWNEPVRWNKQQMLRLSEWRQMAPEMKEAGLRPPQKPHAPTVFPSLCDWLDDEVPVEWLARFLQLIHDTPNLTWLLLTKRPKNFRRLVDGQALSKLEMRKDPEEAELREWLGQWINGQPPANVWVGTSIEDQTWADQRIPALLGIPAVGRFLSVEPLLGPVDLERPMPGPDLGDEGAKICQPWFIQSGIDWVIIGGESGPGARPCNVDWIRSIVRQCKDASVPPFVKQVGAVAFEGRFEGKADPSSFDRCERLKLSHPKGGDPAEWPNDLQVREFPEGLR